VNTKRTDVYVADNGLVKVQDGFNIRMRGVVLETHPAVAKYPTDFRLVGTVDDATAKAITMLGDDATLPRLWERIEPIGTTPATSARPDDQPEPRLPGDKTWPEIAAKYGELAAQPVSAGHRRRLKDRPSRPELAGALHMSPATLKRACAAAGKGTRWPPAGF
jgi:hypothetical protein